MLLMSCDYLVNSHTDGELKQHYSSFKTGRHSAMGIDKLTQHSSFSKYQLWKILHLARYLYIYLEPSR